MTLVAPLAVFWIGGLLLALADGRRPLIGRVAAAILGLGLAATALLTRDVIVLGRLEIVAGNWPAGVGITLRADSLGVTFALTACVVVFVSYLYELAGGIESRTFPALTLFLAAGLTGLFLTGDAFNFYVFFEISMISAYVLAAYGEERRQLRAAVIFAVVNLLGTVFFLFGIVSLYHVTGTLDMAAIAGRMPVVEENPTLIAGTLLFVALALKLGIFPFHTWLPAVYTGVHASVAAMFSGALAMIGAYGLLRIGAGMLPRVLESSTSVLIVLGLLSIVYGGVQAVSRHDPDAVIAYSSIGQVGYILIAIAIGGNVGFAAAVLYTVINSLNKTLLFLASAQSDRYAGIAFAIGGLSVAGIPLAVGFWSKAALIRSTVLSDSEVTRVALTATVVLGGILSILYMFQSFGRTYWHARLGPIGATARQRTAIVSTFAIVVLAFGVWPEPLLALSELAATALIPRRP